MFAGCRFRVTYTFTVAALFFLLPDTEDCHVSFNTHAAEKEIEKPPTIDQPKWREADNQYYRVNITLTQLLH